MSLGPLYVLLGEVSVQVLCPFFNYIVFLMWSSVCSLYILEIKPLSKVSLVNIFSHVIGSFHTCSDSHQHNVLCRNDLWRTPWLDRAVELLQLPCACSHHFSLLIPTEPFCYLGNFAFLPCPITSWGQNRQRWDWHWKRWKGRGGHIKSWRALC